MMLEQLEAKSMNKVMKELPKTIDEKDWFNMKFQAHSLKGASAYAGAGRIHFACYYIQLLYEMKEEEKMIKYYPTLVEAVIEF
jgi:HPt (histidine-containing phosphotransfer) domain-containing protein